MHGPIVPMDLLTLRELRYLDEAHDRIADHPAFFFVRLYRAVESLCGKLRLRLLSDTREARPASAFRP